MNDGGADHSGSTRVERRRALRDLKEARSVRLGN